MCHKRRRKSRHHLSVRKKTASPLREDFGEPESSDEEELLKLRLHALKSTLETDSELKSKKTTSTNLPPDDDIAIIDDHTQGICEEDSLRIQVKTKFQAKHIGNQDFQALRSAVIKRKEFLRKKRQMIRSEDYSPTSFTPLDDDDDIESQLCDIEHNEILSSGSPVDMTKTANDEELELRTLLIQSIRKKDVPRLPSPTPNLVASKQQVLKQAVLRLQQKTLTETMVPCKNELSSLEVESTKQELLGDKLQNDQPCPENSNPPESLAVQPTSECSRLITSFESVTKPVERMVICLESDSDEMHSPKPKKSEAFEKNLDSFLKTIRFRHESSHSKKVVKQNTVKSKDNVSVSGLSKASQIEYQELIRKIKILEEAKQSRLKAKELKRTKVVSEKPVADPSAANYAPGKSQDKADAIQESLKKISTLDRSAQKRLIEKAEKNYDNHKLVYNKFQKCCKLIA